MKLVIVAFLVALLGACSTPNFVGDAPPVPVTSETPPYFELPARFALARVVYGVPQAAGVEETALWTELADRSETLGSFAPLVSVASLYARASPANMMIRVVREPRRPRHQRVPTRPRVSRPNVRRPRRSGAVSTRESLPSCRRGS